MKAKAIHPSIRRLYSVAAEAGDDAPAKVARRLNISPQTMNNWEARGISQPGSLSAQEAYGCSAVWLITGKGEQGQPGAVALSSQSHPLKLDPAMIRQVGRALELRHKKTGGYNLQERPEEFAIAYEIRASMTDAYVDPEVFELVILHADLSPQGASDDGRGSDGAPTNGAPRTATRAGRGR
jgi:phage repressor protein C with HTH and peptisase S24 domain